MNTPSQSGLDLSQIDDSVRVQDDLFGYVNGTWLREHEIAPDKSGESEFTRLLDVSEERVRGIIEDCARQNEPVSHTDLLIGQLFTQFMDETSVNAAGAAPLRERLEEILGAEDREAITRVMAAPESPNGVIVAGVWHDPNDSLSTILHIHQGGLGLPDESYYREEHFAPIREAYVQYLTALAEHAELAGRAGLPEGDAAHLAEIVMDLETRIAQQHVNVVRLRDTERSTNPMSGQERQDAFPAFAWEVFFESIGTRPEWVESVNVRQPEYLAGINDLWADEPLENLRAWLALHSADAAAPYLSQEFADAHFRFHGATLRGTPQQRERWKRAVAFVEGALGEAIGQKYVERYFPPAAKARMEELVAALIDAYRRSITTLEWMTPATREKALEKLEAFTPKIGYPVKWRDYSGLQRDQRSLLQQHYAVLRHEHAFHMAKLGAPVDPDEWHMTPQTVNAYYNPGANEIVFPAAILQPPYFGLDSDDAVNFGGIGAVIGHEIGHGFDDQGSKYDGAGNLKSWWTDEDRTEFEKRTGSLIDDYSAMSPRQLSDEHHVNGAFTIGENIGDLGGLSIALDAYKHVAGDAAYEEIDGFTGIQRLLLAWGVVWRAKYRDEEAIRRLAIDPHSPAEFRANGVVRHIDDFYDVFDVKAGDAMFLAPEKRVSIW